MKWKLGKISLLSLLSSSLWAGTMGDYGPIFEEIRATPWIQVITLSLGPAWYNSNQHQQHNYFPIALMPAFSAFFTPADYYHTYVPLRRTGTLGDAELYFALGSPALINPIGNPISGQLGIAIGYSGSANQEGHLNIGNPFDATNYAYSYRVSNARLSLKGKLASEWEYWAKPYITASIGAAANRSWHYATTHSILGQPSQPQFSDKTCTSFTYTVGAGLQTYLTPEWQIGIGYEFADWGKNSLSAPTFKFNPSIPYAGLHSSSFNTHELQFSLSYLIRN